MYLAAVPVETHKIPAAPAREPAGWWAVAGFALLWWVIGVVVPLGSVSAASGEGLDAVWDELPPLPTAISNNAVTSVENGNGTTTFYSFMGITSPSDPDSIMPAAFKMVYPGCGWEAIANAPRLSGRAKIGANAVTVGGAVYLIGGYTVAGGVEVTERRLFRYDAAADRYEQMAPVPVEVDDTVAAVYLDRYIYLVSGWHGPISDNVRSVQVYDTHTDSWGQRTEISAPVPGLFGHAGAIVRHELIYSDGVLSSSGFPISDRVFVGRLDLTEPGALTVIPWTERDAHPGRPTYRAAASQAAAADRFMLLVGGTDNPYNFSGIGYNGVASQPLDQVLEYRPSTNTWRTLKTGGDHSASMDHRGLVRQGECWVTIGGMTAPGVTTNRVFRLTPIDALTEGDFNCDLRVDLSDFSAFVGCRTAPDVHPVAPGCAAGDLDDDGDADWHDFAVLQRRIGLR